MATRPTLLGSSRRRASTHIPVFDKSARRDGTFERADFVYDHADDSYISPGGKRLRQRRKVYREPRPFVDENGLMRYRASKLDCDACGVFALSRRKQGFESPRERQRDQGLSQKRISPACAVCPTPARYTSLDRPGRFALRLTAATAIFIGSTGQLKRRGSLTRPFVARRWIT